MAIFISYSHADKKIVDKLAITLVKHNAHVWVDTWEINVGDSILTKVQDAITESSALLVVLSKASVKSEWCKKELNAGLMRELDEKRVVVLPVLVEDCDIPLFLKEKKYADLRTNFNFGVGEILSAVAKVTNPSQSRIEKDDGYLDWAEDLGEVDGKLIVRYTIVQSLSEAKQTLLVEIEVLCNEVSTARYHQCVKADLDWLYRKLIAEALFEFGSQEDRRVLFVDQNPVELRAMFADTHSDERYEILVRGRRLGEDTGKDQLVDLGGYLTSIRDYLGSVSRKPTEEELVRFNRIRNSALAKVNSPLTGVHDKHTQE